MIYFDNAATTKVHHEVYESMKPYLLDEYGNPTSKYYSVAVSANEAIKTSKLTISKALSVSTEELVFTSGSTESNNLIIKGIAFNHLNEKGHFITTPVEHSSTLEVYLYLEKLGFDVTYLPVDKYGRVSATDLENAIQDNTLLVSIIWANNEIGSLNDMGSLSQVCNQRKVPLHVDATQAIGKLRIDLSKYPGIQFLSLSAHKIFGPKGSGLAVLRKDTDGITPALTPLIHGGGQQNNYRSGTLPVHQIVGLSKAIELSMNNFDENLKYLKELDEYFQKNLTKKLNGLISFNSDNNKKIPGIINIQLKGIPNELLLKRISQYVAASSGSACSISKPSHVLKAIGYSEQEIRNSIRLSISINNTFSEIDKFLELF